MDNMPDAIYFKDRNSRFIRVSKVSCPGMGIKNPEDAAGMTDFDFSPKEMAEQFMADDQMVMESGKSMVGKEEVMLSKVGKTWYSATKVPIRNKDGEVIGLVGISRDITKIKQTEEELRRYSTQLEELVEERTKKLREVQRLAAIGETAAMVGHDLRNPLQTVAAIPYMVEQIIKVMPASTKGYAEKKGLPGLMDMLRDQTVYMNKIVSDLQDYARPVNLDLNATNLHAMVNETMYVLHVPENVEVNNEIRQDFTAFVDSYLIKRVMTNLILNAIQAMPEGGKLTITASSVDDKVSLSVQDTGVGISEENIPRLFQPLFTTKAKGQGLGLPVCKRIVEAHGGKFTVTSRVGCGSTFTVYLPLRTEVKHVE
jgi:PAS domain S-box-containing protein